MAWEIPKGADKKHRNSARSKVGGGGGGMAITFIG